MSPLEAKEGVLLDRDGNPIAAEGTEFRPSQARAMSWNAKLGPIIGTAFIALALFAGLTLVGVLIAAVFGFWLIRSLLQLLGFASPRPRTIVRIKRRT